MRYTRAYPTTWFAAEREIEQRQEADTGLSAMPPSILDSASKEESVNLAWSETRRTQ